MVRENNGKFKSKYPGKNYQAVILGTQKTDWIAGVNSPIVSSPFTEDADWKDYTSSHEHQVYNLGNGDAYDTSLCTQFAGTDAIEHLINYYREEESIPDHIMRWFIDNDYIVEGKFEISERLGGANSGMTTKGTYLYRMADSIKDFGIVPQSKLPLAENFYDNINPELIPDDIYALGKESKGMVTINWNWVPRSQVSEKLKQGPLVATVKYANASFPEEILKPSGRHNHAILVVNEEDGYYEIDDSYFRQYKRYDKNYIGDFLQFHITFNTTNMKKDEFIQEHDTYIVRNVNTGAYGVVYDSNFLVVATDRAGIFSLDRLTRNYDKQKMVSITNEEWNILNDEKLTF
jgi:hypothetical protein